MGCAVCTSSIKQDESERTKKMMLHNAHGGEEQISRMQKSSRLGFCPIQFIAFKYSNNQGLFCFSTANLVGESFQLINPLPAPRCNRRHFELADGLFRLFLRFENRSKKTDSPLTLFFWQHFHIFLASAVAAFVGGGSRLVGFDPN